MGRVQFVPIHWCLLGTFGIIMVVVMLVNENTIKLGSQLKVLVLGRPTALLHCY